MPRRIFLDNDDEPEVEITRKNTATAVVEAADSLVVTVHLATTKDGAAIDPSLNKSATERTSKAGTYFAIFDGDDLRTHLASLTGKIVYYVWLSGADIKANEPVKVTAERVI